VARRLDQGEPTFASAVKLLDDGDATMKALEEKILESRHHVHLEYYIWEPDQVGTHFRDLLAAAARRGVQVRVLYDAMGSPKVNRKFWAPLREAGGEVIAFNPVRLLRITFGNFRSHRKIAICDGLAGFLGGINMHDPASATRSGKDAWRDQHVRIDGEPVHRIQQLFLENWNYSGGKFQLNAGNLDKYFPAARTGKGHPGADHRLRSRRHQPRRCTRTSSRASRPARRRILDRDALLHPRTSRWNPRFASRSFAAWTWR
jgi:cardiolipin synthase